MIGQRIMYVTWLTNEGSPERRGQAWLDAVLRPTNRTRVEDVPTSAIQSMYEVFHTHVPPGNGIVIC